MEELVLKIKNNNDRKYFFNFFFYKQKVELYTWCKGDWYVLWSLKSLVSTWILTEINRNWGFQAIERKYLNTFGCNTRIYSETISEFVGVPITFCRIPENLQSMFLFGSNLTFSMVWEHKDINRYRHYSPVHTFSLQISMTLTSISKSHMSFPHISLI